MGNMRYTDLLVSQSGSSHVGYGTVPLHQTSLCDTMLVYIVFLLTAQREGYANTDR